MENLLWSWFPSPKAPSLRMSSTKSGFFKYSSTNTFEFFTKTSSNSYCILLQKGKAISIRLMHLNAQLQFYLQWYCQSSSKSPYTLNNMVETQIHIESVIDGVFHPFSNFSFHSDILDYVRSKHDRTALLASLSILNYHPEGNNKKLVCLKHILDLEKSTTAPAQS